MDWAGKLVFDRLRMNTMPDWFTADPGKKYIVRNIARGTEEAYSGKQLSEGKAIKIKAAEEIILIIK